MERGSERARFNQAGCGQSTASASAFVLRAESRRRHQEDKNTVEQQWQSLMKWLVLYDSDQTGVQTRGSGRSGLFCSGFGFLRFLTRSPPLALLLSCVYFIRHAVYELEDVWRWSEMDPLVSVVIAEYTLRPLWMEFSASCKSIDWNDSSHLLSIPSLHRVAPCYRTSTLQLLWVLGARCNGNGVI